jgi:3-hydroxybutyryl-CoA dehydrogenase
MEIKSIGIIGAGQMGSGIALVAARSGFQVMMHDIKEELVQRGVHTIVQFLDKEASRDKIDPADKSAILQRIKTSAKLNDLQPVDFIIEAASENPAVKFQIFSDLDRICAPEVILSTNTSSIPVGRIAAHTRRPDKVIGMHFMNPAPLMKLVEIIRSLATSEETFKTTCALSERFAKVPAEARDFPGFISNRILMTMINEAIFTLYHGVGSRDAIDAVMHLGMNHPMGPLALADLIGLDTCLAVMETLYDGYKDPKYRPCPLLRQYVDAGWLGRKSGRGFYSYEPPQHASGASANQELGNLLLS